MNISLLQLPNSKYVHIVYISIIASLLLGAIAGPSLLRAAAQDDDASVLGVLCNSYGEGVDVSREGRSERISFGEWLADFRPGLVDLFSEVGCAGIPASITGGGTVRAIGTHLAQTNSACVPEPCPRFDQRFVLDDELRVRTDILVYQLRGDLDGTAIGLFTQTRYVGEDRTFTAWYVALTYVGTMGDSDVGSFRMILSKICDNGRTPACQGQFTVAEGSGQEAFEGICGGGLYEFDSGEGTYDLVLRFGEACDDFDWTEIKKELAKD